MVEIDILKAVYEQTEWINLILVVLKTVEIDFSSAHAPNHRIRRQILFYIAHKDLNHDIEREHYYYKNIDELMKQLNGTICFTIVDIEKDF